MFRMASIVALSLTIAGAAPTLASADTSRHRWLRDRREDVRDRREDIRDRRENIRDRREDRRDERR